MTPGHDALDQRTLRESEWCYGLWLDRHSFSAIRRLAARKPKHGGLGYDLSESAIKGLVRQAREARGDLSMTREERADRRQAERDELARLARAGLARAAEVEQVDDKAAKLLLDVHKAEREEYGDDAPSKLEVTTRDAVTAELDAMMAAAGVTPIPERTPE